MRVIQARQALCVFHPKLGLQVALSRCLCTPLPWILSRLAILSLRFSARTRTRANPPSRTRTRAAHLTITPAYRPLHHD